jgi:hypothetical protein
VLGAVVVGQIAAFGWAAHRYTVGMARGLISRPIWEPPGGLWLVTTMFTLTVSAYALWIGSAVGQPDEAIPPAR